MSPCPMIRSLIWPAPPRTAWSRRCAPPCARPGARPIWATIYDLDVDVFSPCAVGGVLHPGTIDRLRCAVVVGAANNQLADAAADAALHARGIRYAPDYAVNAGAVALGAAYFLDMAFDPIETVQRAVERIGETVRRIFDESDAAGEPPGAVADRLAAEALVRPRSTERQWWPVA